MPEDEEDEEDEIKAPNAAVSILSYISTTMPMTMCIAGRQEMMNLPPNSSRRHRRKLQKMIRDFEKEAHELYHKAEEYME